MAPEIFEERHAWCFYKHVKETLTKFKAGKKIIQERNIDYGVSLEGKVLNIVT